MGRDSQNIFLSSAWVSVDREVVNLHVCMPLIYRSLGIFHRLNISSVEFSRGFIFVAITTQQYKLTPFIRQRKYFVGLIFVVEGD